MSGDKGRAAPLAVDLFCGLGGWTEGLLAEGWVCRGYDIEAHEYDGERYPGDLVLRDILQMHGSEIADADLIVSSSSCTEFAYRAMPWKRAKALTPDEVGLRAPAWWELPQGKMQPYELDLWIEWRRLYPRPPPTLGIALFDAQFRLQREASEAAGRYIPMVVENVRGAQLWVGRARANYGSYYLWGDVPALLPCPGTKPRMKTPVSASPRLWRDRVVEADNPLAHALHLPVRDDARKNPGFRFDGSGRSFQSESVARHVGDGRKGVGSGAEWFDQNLCALPSSSPRRKAASAKIAKIPFALSSHIARVYRPALSTLSSRRAA